MKVCRIKDLYLATKKIDIQKAGTLVALKGSYPPEQNPSPCKAGIGPVCWHSSVDIHTQGECRIPGVL